jgi:uncharacterized protein (DUF3084 family)
MSDGTMEGALDSVSSQVTEAFGKLTHLQDELRARLQTVAERERGLDDAKRALDDLTEELESRNREICHAEEENRSRVAELERRASEMEETHRQRQAQCAEREARVQDREAECTAREARADEREAQLTRREEVVAAFQEMLAQMHTALDTLAPDNIMTALDAGTAYEDRVKSTRPSASDTTDSEEESPARDPIGLTPQEQARFFVLRDAGKSDAEILAEIYEARADRTGEKA